MRGCDRWTDARRRSALCTLVRSTRRDSRGTTAATRRRLGRERSDPHRTRGSRPAPCPPPKAQWPGRSIPSPDRTFRERTANTLAPVRQRPRASWPAHPPGPVRRSDPALATAVRASARCSRPRRTAKRCGIGHLVAQSKRAAVDLHVGRHVAPRGNRRYPRATSRSIS